MDQLKIFAIQLEHVAQGTVGRKVEAECDLVVIAMHGQLLCRVVWT
jgi:hypothetical protein